MKKLYLLAVGLLLLSCSQKKQHIEIIDLEAGIENKQYVDFAKIAKIERVTILENIGKESLVGEIRSIKEDNDTYYIASQKKVLAFDKNGKFKHQYGSVGRGPGEYPALINFNINDKNIYIKSLKAIGIICYDSNNKPLFTKPINFHQFTFVGNNIVAVNPQTLLQDGAERVILKTYDNRLTLLDSITLPGKHIGIQGNMRKLLPDIIFNNSGEQGIFLKEPLSDTLFNLSTQLNIEPAYILKLGKHKFPSKAYSNFNEWAKYHYITSINSSKNKFIITTVKGLMNATNHIYIYDKISKESITPTDSKGKAGCYIDDIPFKPLYIYNNKLVGSMNPIDILSKEKISVPEISEIKNRIDEHSNPVIISLAI